MVDGHARPARIDSAGRAVRPTGPSEHALRAAFAATAYHVDASPVGPFVIRCGEVSPPLEALLDLVRPERPRPAVPAADGWGPFDTWTYVTAANPAAVRQEDAENRRRHATLRAAVTALGLPSFPGRSVADAGDWPPEESLLVLGIAPAAATALAESFGQLAVVVGARGRPARLVWTARPEA